MTSFTAVGEQPHCLIKFNPTVKTACANKIHTVWDSISVPHAQFLFRSASSPAVWPGAQGDSVPDVLLDHRGSVHLSSCHHGSR